MKKAVIVGGIHRSGTTLMQRLLGCHSEIAMPKSEFNFFTKIFDKHSKNKELDNDSLQQVVDKTFNLPKVQEWGIMKPTVNKGSFSDIYISFLEENANLSGKSIIGEKSPGNEFYYSLLKEWFNDYEFHFIHLIRSPYDVASSLNNYQGSAYGGKPMNDKQLTKWCHRWNSSAKLALKRVIIEPGYQVIRYEDLINDPLSKVKSLCGELGIPDESQQMVNLNGNASESTETNNTSFVENENNAETIVGNIKKISVDRYELLSMKQRSIINNICGEYTEIFDYLKFEQNPSTSIFKRLNLIFKRNA